MGACYCNICTSWWQNIPPTQVVNEGQDQHGHRLECDAGIPWTQNKVTHASVYKIRGQPLHKFHLFAEFRSKLWPCWSWPSATCTGDVFNHQMAHTCICVYIQYQCQCIICMYNCEVCIYVLCVYLCASWERTVSYSKTYTGEIYSMGNFSACTSDLTKWSNLRCYESHTHTHTHTHTQTHTHTCMDTPWTLNPPTVVKPW